MARNMSFMLTTQQVYDGTKDVTRRWGWKFAKMGDRYQACEKCQGLGKGGKIKRIRMIEVVRVDFEPLSSLLDYPEYGKKEMIREGFPSRDPADFIAMIHKSRPKNYEGHITRIEFKYVDQPKRDAFGEARAFAQGGCILPKFETESQNSVAKPNA